MADPKKPVNPFGSTTKKKTTTKKVATNPFGSSKAKPAAKPAQEQNAVLSAGQTFLDVISTPVYAVEGFISGLQKGTNPFEAAGKNATAWTREGEKVVTGSDLLKNSGLVGKKGSGKPIEDGTPGAFIAGLVADIALDPLTYTPGVVFSAPLKATGAAARAATKAARLAEAGNISEKLVSKAVEGAKPATLKGPGSDLINQYARKPIIPANMIRTEGAVADRLGKARETVGNKFTYRTVQSADAVTPSQVVGSSIEAGTKAAAATFLLDFAKYDMKKLLRAEKKAGNIAARAANAAGEPVELKPYDIHVADDGVYVFDGKNFQTFASEADANAWRSSQNAAPTTAAVVTTGTKPVLDTAPGSLTKIVDELPAMNLTQKQAKSMLTKVNKLVAGVTGNGGVVVSAGQKLPLRSDVQTKFTQIATGVQDPIEYLRALRGRVKSDPRSQDAAIANHFSNISITGKDGSVLTLGELALSKTRFNQLSKETQNQISKIFNEFAQDPTVGRVTQAGDSVEKRYANYNQLIAGLKSGDQVDMKVLTQIVKALDPEAKLLTQLDKAASAETQYQQIAGILIGPGAETIYSVERRIELVDAATMMEAEGLHLSEVVGAYLMSRISNFAPASEKAAYESRKSAQATVATAMGNPDMSKSLNASFNAINKGLSGYLNKKGERIGGQLVYIEDILSSPDVVQGISNNGDLAVRNTEDAYMAGTKAALVKAHTQYGESRILANLVSVLRSRLANEGVKKGGELNEVFAEDLLRLTQQHMELVDDIMLAALGARTVYAKAEIKGAKHFLYMSAGDTLRILDEQGGSSVLQRALFSDEKDNFDFVAIANAVRMAVESKVTKVPLEEGQLVGELLRQEGKRTWSKEFKAQSKELAAELEAIITNADTIAKFEDAHNLKAIAAVEDATNSVETLTMDVFTSLIEGMKANFNKNIDSDAARAALVRDWFYKLVYATGILDQQNGSIAAAMLQASAMIFVNDGRLVKLVKDAEFQPALIGSPTAKNELDRQLYEEVKTAINSMFKNQADHVKISPKLEDRIVKDLTETKQKYNAVIDTLTEQSTKAQTVAWAKRVEKAQLKLDQARKLAQQHGVSTEHRYPDGSWVETTRYDHASAVKMAEEMRLGTKVLDDGVANLGERVLDSDTASLVVSKLSIKKSKEIIKQWTEEGKILSAKAAAAAREEAATRTIKKMDEIEALPLTDGEKASYIVQDITNETMLASKITVRHGANTYGKAPSKMVDGKDVVQRKGAFDRLGERISGTSGRWNLAPLLARAESNIMQNFSSISDVMHHIRSEYLNLWSVPGATKAENQAVRSQKFLEAFQLAKNEIDVMPQGMDPAVFELAVKLRQVLDPIFGNAATSAAKNIPSEALANAFMKFGLGDTMGFVSPGVLTPEDFANYLNWVPFGKNPNDPAEKLAWAAWEARAEKFRNESVDPFIVMSRMVQAVQFAKTEAAFVMDFANQFGWQRHFKTFEEAVNAGWVKIEGVGPGGSNLSNHLPSPEKGGLFPPEIADEFLSMNREWNNLYNSKGAPKFIRTVMEITGFFKATQTILRPGHHVTNFIGDATAAMIAGVLNPIHWKNGFDIAMEFAGADAKATWGKNKLEGKFKQLFLGYEGYGRAFEGTTREGASIPQITIATAGGGTKKLNLTKEELVNAFRERNILTGNIFQDNIQGLYESVTADALATGVEQSALKMAAAKAQLGLQKIEQPFGSFAAYYGNITRSAHALKVMQSRSWSSLDEALNAASTEVARYHPTIQSLSSSERKYPRLIFTYYTWLRVAHNALLDMTMNHTAAMMIPSKFQYQQAEQNGMQPTSFGNPWLDKTSTPNYLNYSVYGPTETGPNGRVVYKRSFLPLDVLDTWNFTYDPARTMDQNAFEAWNSAGRVVGKNINLVAQPGVELLTGTDPSTGKPSQVKDIQSLSDKLLGNIGTVGLLKGLGVYTPMNKQPGTANPTTPEDQQRMLRNWITGAKETWVDTAQNQKNAQTEQTSRANLIYEQYLKSQQGK